MTQDKRESRRAFMKKFGQIAGAAVVPFMAMAAKEAVAAPNEDNPVTSCANNCTNDCAGTCKGHCGWGCDRTCADQCEYTCTGTCCVDCSGTCAFIQQLGPRF